MKPYSKACDNNKQPILNELKSLFCSEQHVLEIGSGTGQHAVFFAEQMPTLFWQTSDCIGNHSGINQWIDEGQLTNIAHPIELDVSNSVWPDRVFDNVFTANTCHIMHWHDVIAMFKGVSKLLTVNGTFVIYGPFINE